MGFVAKLDVRNLGDYIREQRSAAQISLRQLASLAGVSNPYLSQIERGLKKPSAEILQQLAKGLEVSAESLYVRAGILDERHGHETGALDTRAVIGADPELTDRQKAALLDIYDSFVGAGPAAKTAGRRGRKTSTTPATTTAGKPATKPATKAATKAATHRTTTS